MEEETDRHMTTSWYRCLRFVGLFCLFVVMANALAAAITTVGHFKDHMIVKRIFPLGFPLHRMSTCPWSSEMPELNQSTRSTATALSNHGFVPDGVPNLKCNCSPSYLNIAIVSECQIGFTPTLVY